MLELKTISLVGLIAGEIGWWEKNPDYNSLEETLLNRKYYYWCKDKERYEVVKVKKIIDRGIEQIRLYINALKRIMMEHMIKEQM